MKIIRNIIMLVLLGIVLFAIDNSSPEKVKKKQSNIDNNKYTTVGELGRRGRNSTPYAYYYNNKRHEGSFHEDSIDTGLLEEKYFVVELSTQHPEFSRILLDQEITDSAQISNSGFRAYTLTEILNEASSGEK